MDKFFRLDVLAYMTDTMELGTVRAITRGLLVNDQVAIKKYETFVRKFDSLKSNGASLGSYRAVEEMAEEGRMYRDLVERAKESVERNTNRLMSWRSHFVDVEIFDN